MKQIMTILLLFFITTCSTTTVNKSGHEVKGRIIDYGVIIAESESESYELPDQPGRYGGYYDGMQIVKTTNRIPLEKGVAFGIIWKLVGLHEKKIDVTYSVAHPEMVLEDGKRSSSATEIMSHTVVDGKVCSMDGYIITDDYELVPGEWKVSVKYRNVEITKTFLLELEI